ncbi:MAG: FHA domain-containing protein [Chloroflexi bacterium]|nr:FHA domain-containing protein [Chloroflexota bacterium]
MVDVSAAVTILVLRVGVVAALVLFVLLVFRTLRAELASASHAPEAAESLTDVIEVVACDEAPALAGKRYPLEAVSSIGRDPDNTVMIPDPRVSARHARLVWRNGQWWVEDLGSTNGTLLNGRPVLGLTRLGRNDLLCLGPATLRVRSA